MVSLETVRKEIERLFIEANYFLPEDVVESLRLAEEREESEIGRSILARILENERVARERMLPLCQDTGHAIVFIEKGEEVVFDGVGFYDAINDGVRNAYSTYLRKSIVSDPLRRKNTNDNTPAFIQIEIVRGDRLKIIAAVKGSGSENMSAFNMLLPHEGFQAVEKFVLDTVENAGPNPCPPVVVGVGIGGTFDICARLSKKALYRERLQDRNKDPYYAGLEERLLQKINASGVGPQGMGGRITALAVHIETYPCHIGSLPVAVSIGGHSHRHKQVVI